MLSHKYNRKPLGFLDKIIIVFDQCIRTCYGPQTYASNYPATDHAKHHQPSVLSTTERSKSATLMRINHTGEICAQALYLGQSITTRDKETANHMKQAAQEECAHLAWCAQRLDELGDRCSYLNPMWFTGSLAIGMIAGLSGDAISFGFVCETENQVIKHLEKHLAQLPRQDHASRAILEQMKVDEAKHATQALQRGGTALPLPIKLVMKFTSKFMTTITRYV